MASLTTFPISLEPELMSQLDEAAARAGLTREQMAEEAIAQQFEIALRHRVVLARLEEVDAHIVALAEFVAEASATPDQEQVASFCRYRPEREEAAE